MSNYLKEFNLYGYLSRNSKNFSTFIDRTKDYGVETKETKLKLYLNECVIYNKKPMKINYVINNLNRERTSQQGNRSVP